MGKPFPDVFRSTPQHGGAISHEAAMNRFLALAFAVAALLVIPQASRSAEPPHLDFVRGLRDRGYPDLALEYLQKLAAKPPADIAATLPLEMARCRLDVAKTIPDLAQRQRQYTEARTEFQTFLDKNPNSPLAATARGDIAQVTVLLGRAQLARMRQEGSADGKAKLAAVARVLLTDAAKSLENVLKQLDTQIAKLEAQIGMLKAATPEERAQKKQLEDALKQVWDAHHQIELELGLVQLDQAETYIDPENADNNKARGEVVKKAITILDRLSLRDRLHPTCWLARAYLGRCHNENGDPGKARSTWAVIFADNTPASNAAKRIARFYRLELLVSTDAKDENPIQLAEDWRKTYPTFRNTPEGCGVRYILANLKFRAAAQPKVTAQQKAALLTEAKGLCQDLEQFENDYRNVAFRLKIQIIKIEGGFDRKIDTLRTFDDAYIRARYEADVLETELKKATDAAKVEELKKEQFAKITDALTRALDLAKKAPPAVAAKIPINDVHEARSILAYAYLAQGNLTEAARAGEELAYAKPRINQSLQGAIYALQAYAQMLDEKKGDEKEVKENLRKVATFIKQTWSEDQTADMARHRLGMLLYKEGQYKAGYDELSAIKPSYPEAILSSYLQAMCAQALQEQENPADRAWEQKALAALFAMPELPPAPDPVLAQTYIQAKLALGAQLFKQKKFSQVEQIASALLTVLGNVKLPANVTEELKAMAVQQVVLAKYVQADAEFKAGQFAKANAMLTPVVEALQKGEMAELKKNPELQWGFLGLALRTKIQDGKLPEAQQVLKVIQKLSEEGDFAAGATKTMASIVQLLAEQVADLRRKGETEKLQRTKGALADFLDTMAKQKDQTPEVSLLLAQSYIAVDDGKKASEIAKGWLEKNKEPAPPARGQPASQERARWEMMKIFHIRALRLDKQVEAARAQIDETFKPVGKEPGWGLRNLEARKENCFVFQAEQKWKEAATGWNQLVTQLQKLRDDNRMKDHYFECYHWLVYSLYHHALTLESPKKEETIRSAAKYIADLEAAVPDLGGKQSKDRFDDLLKSAAALKTEYDQLKKPAGQ